MSVSHLRWPRPLLVLVFLSVAAWAACSSSKRYSAEIGAAGGSLVGPGGVRIDVPPGAVDQTFTLVASTAPGVRTPSGTAGVATGFRLEPEGQTFAKPLEITVPISASALPGGTTIDDVLVLRAPHGSDVFVPLPTRRVGSAVIAETEHFSDFIAVVLEPGEGGLPFGACGDGMCLSDETCASCPLECGLCMNGDVDAGVPRDGGAPLDAGVRVDGGTPVRFADNGDGSATDSLTTLQWATAPTMTLTDQPTAIAYCQSLTIGSNTDWRLPTIREVVAFMDYSGGPMYDTAVFPNVPPADYFWLSDPFVDAAGSAWQMHGANGLFNYQFTSANSGFTWCVRGTQSMAPITLVDNGDGTVADANAGLTWQADHSAILDHASAEAYCAGLALGGPGVWRMPTLAELFRIIRYDLANPAVDTALFTTTSFSTYWASNKVGNYAWFLNEVYGQPSNTTTNSSISVRCVR